MKKIKIEIYEKINNKYVLKNNYFTTKKAFLHNYISAVERRGDDVRIKYHYFYTDLENIDIYYSNGWKYSYYNVPCSSPERVDTYKLLK